MTTIKQQTSDAVVKKLDRALSVMYSLYVKVQNYHWNISGPNFGPLHIFFGEQYDAIGVSIDEIAERIRALGMKVDGSIAHFAQNSNMKAPNHNFNSKEMIVDLIESHTLLCSSLTEAMQEADRNTDVVSSDMLLQYLQYHQKMIWMLQANLE